MKKLINHPQNVPAEFLAGLALPLAHADILRVCLDPVYVVRVDASGYARHFTSDSRSCQFLMVDDSAL
jgi:hypothetical protein